VRDVDGKVGEEGMSDEQRYGDPLSLERQTELRALLDAVAGTDGPARPPFAGVRLTGADVSWLADLDRQPNRTVPNLHLEGAVLFRAHLEDAILPWAHLEGVDLWQAHLEGALLNAAHLEDASLFETHLEGATLFKAHLEGARLLRARLEGADLAEAELAGARLDHSWLESADLTRAQLGGKTYAPEDADLARIHHVNPAFPATLPPADLRDAVLDGATVLRDATLSAPDTREAPRVADVHWGGASLAKLDWPPFTRQRTPLGDESAARVWRPAPYVQPDELKLASRQAQAKDRRAHRRTQRSAGIAAWASATRANGQLARALWAQGMGDEARHFAYRARVTRRGLLRRRRAWGRWLASGLLASLAGYGYRLWRALVIYLVVIALFTGLYLLASGGFAPLGLTPAAGHAFQWYDALALSVSSFHGRGFFQFPLTPSDPIALLGVIESAIGLFIELGVIAALASRYLGER
jgi:uncharacterized protein YjbI with pentapeptide repeats